MVRSVEGRQLENFGVAKDASSATPKRADVGAWQSGAENIVHLFDIHVPRGILQLTDCMSKLNELMERAKAWPEWRQDDAAYLLEMMEESGTSVYRLSDDEREAVREGLESPVMSDAELKAFRNRHKA